MSRQFGIKDNSTDIREVREVSAPTSSGRRSLALRLVSKDVHRPSFVLSKWIQHSLVRPQHYGGDGTGEVAFCDRRTKLDCLHLRIFANPSIGRVEFIVNAFHRCRRVYRGMVCLFVRVVMKGPSGWVLGKGLSDDLADGAVVEVSDEDREPVQISRCRKGWMGSILYPRLVCSIFPPDCCCLLLPCGDPNV